MHSSTSSSETEKVNAAAGTRGAHPLFQLLILLALALAGLELAGRVGFVRISRIQRRTADQYKEAISLPKIVNGKPTLLVVGNSLMLEGVDIPQFRSELSDRYHVAPFFIERTAYVDWYYGLRRLFNAGSRPSTVLLGLSVNNVMVENVRDEYFAYFMLSGSDYVDLVRTLKLDPTTASNYLFANVSGWLGSKAEIRNWLLFRMMPDVEKFGHALQRPGAQFPDATVLRVARARLTMLQRLCDEHAARLLIVVPPILAPSDQSEVILKAGELAGVPVIVPIQPGYLGADNFRDGYHLNAQGAHRFTRLLSVQLPDYLAARL